MRNGSFELLILILLIFGALVGAIFGILYKKENNSLKQNIKNTKKKIKDSNLLKENKIYKIKTSGKFIYIIFSNSKNCKN